MNVIKELSLTVLLSFVLLYIIFADLIHNTAVLLYHCNLCKNIENHIYVSCISNGEKCIEWSGIEYSLEQSYFLF